MLEQLHVYKTNSCTCFRDNFIIFSGGLPRASYGDKHTASIMQGSNHVVLDFTSKVIDFCTLTCAKDRDTQDDRAEYDEPHALIVLVEEELFVIDLEADKWPMFRLPYASSLHSSAITCAQHISNVPKQLLTKIVDLGDAQQAGYTKRVGNSDRLKKDSVMRVTFLLCLCLKLFQMELQIG